MKNNWKIRRALIFATVGFGFAMIISGAVGLFGDKFTGELVYGGVTLITAVVSAYTGFATYDDKWNGESPDG